MGTLWNRSGLIERYADDIPAAGAQAFFYQGGTLVPQAVYQNGNESTAHPFPVVADSRGRWPDVFVPYVTSYDVQVTTAQNVQLTYTQLIPNPNPAGTTTVNAPAAQLLQTGMTVFELTNQTRTGFVRLNGRTIGSSASAATERNNDDTSALYSYLWTNVPDTIATVQGGRGSTAAADFAANKIMTLPDFRGYCPVGLDDMGNSAAGAFSGLAFNVGNATTPGSAIGINSQTLNIGQMPIHSHGGGVTSTDGLHSHVVTVSGTASGTTSAQSNDHTHFVSGTTGGQSNDHTHNMPFVVGTSGQPGSGLLSITGGTTATTGASADHTHSFSATSGGMSASHTHTFSATVNSSGGTDSQGNHNHTFTTGSAGSGGSFNNMSTSRLGTWYIKL